MRTDFDPDQIGPGGFYKFLTSVIVPRAIAWVVTRSADGVDNLAPHSFFTVASTDPPVVQFTSVGEKDSLRNAVASGEFTVCLTPEPLLEHINATATDFPPHESEIDATGLTREPSLRIATPRIAESPVALECRLERTIEVGNCVLVLGRVVHAAVADDALVDGRPDVKRLAPLARLGGNQWSTVGEVLATPRIRYDDWPGHFSDGDASPST
ncbi:flavin reductase family protein [Actinomycetospora straminea]|uniref:Flavin reductase family protein n=1 Tax=Actinomycetospora straminea TaxID=663607 RepID=A0ABP9EGD3_9PSEU|nr:flavin reductase family protein [Actinomycetospora straminea]MDD7935289.1 flavin reductase family protein [Actinomycetospora straminea]